MFRVEDARARKIVNSRASWAVELELKINGKWYRASVPAGKSRGKHEAVQIPADKSLELFPEFKKLITGEYGSQEEFDHRLIEIAGEKKERFGVDLVLASSIAFMRAQGIPHGKELPTPMLNIINGGKHAGNELAVQEFMIVPVGFDSFKAKIEAAVAVYNTLKELLERKFGKSAINVGDEGGFAPPISETREALEMLENAVDEAGFTAQMAFSLDCAASSYFKDGKYLIDGKELKRGEYIEHIAEIANEFGLFSVEDPMQEEDFEGFAEFRELFHGYVVGDDLTVTQLPRIKLAHEKNAINALLVKPNQVGTITETLEAIEFAKKAGWAFIISHRSGETNDAFIAHLAVATKAPLIKAGAPARGERIAKYNELLRIEEKIEKTD